MGKTIGLGGDGRYFNKDAAQIIIKMAAAAGVKKVSFTGITSCTLANCRSSTSQGSYTHSIEPFKSPVVQVLVGQNAIMATPAMSALIRRRKLYGRICTASQVLTCITHCL